MTEKAIPLTRQQRVLELVLGRLKDKSTNVRRQAVQLLTAFLKGNPFAAKVSFLVDHCVEFLILTRKGSNLISLLEL